MIFRVLPIAIYILIMATQAFAESGHRSTTADMTYRFINFFILFGALYFILAKPLREYLASRSDGIKKALDEAKRIREEAEKRLDEYKAKMEKLNAEAQAIKDSLVAEGNHEKARIIEEANKAAQRIKDQARFTAEQETKKARIALKEEMAELIAGLAEEKIKKGLGDADHERLVRDYLTAAGGVR